MCRSPYAAAVATIVASLLIAATSRAADPEQACHKGRYAAAAKYAACQIKAASGVFDDAADFDKLAAAAGRCRVKYFATWAKLQAKAAGTSSRCDAPRFVNNGPTITDNLTGLEWQKQTDDDGVRDQDMWYDWSNGTTEPDGSVFTTFLEALNDAGAGCLALRCDWRLPSREELQTILAGGYPCASNPCIDPLFSYTNGYFYWTSATYPSMPQWTWNVHFGNGYVYFVSKEDIRPTRAVRGGL